MTEWNWPEERGGLERATAKWWAFLALGVVASVLGVVLLFDLFAAVRTLAFLVALGLIVTGLQELVAAGRYESRMTVVAGVVLVVGGVLAAAWPGITLWVLAVIAGIGLIASGAARIVGAMALRVEGWGWLLVGGIVSVVIGIMALAWPDATILALGFLLGLRMLLFGLAEIAFAFTLRWVRDVG